VTILVYGAGGVGAFFGGLLARAGQPVQFVARGAHLEALTSRGIRIESTILGTIETGPLKASARAADAGPADLVLVSVKTHQTAGILDDLASAVRDDTIVVPLQNGVEADREIAARVGSHRVAAAVVYVGATLETPGVVSHVAAGTIALGAPSGFDAARLGPVREVLATSGQPVRVSVDIDRERWQKLLWNTGFNPVSALTGRAPAELLAVPASRALVRGLMLEVVAVARAEGHALTEADADEQIRWTEGASSAIRTSMMVDRERGRPMETEALVGVVVRRGRARGVATPLSDVIYALLSASENSGYSRNTAQVASA
jgi:2-dehydropantoate 2-reductase